MPLTAANMFPGGPVKSADAIEYFNLLTGAMTDQPVTLANTLTAGGSHGVGSVPFRVNGVAAQTANMHEIRALATDVNPIFAIGPDGTLKWGPGGGTATDTTLSRSSPGALRVSGLAVAVSNLLVNGGFEIWQRGTTSVALTTGATYRADRWMGQLTGTGAATYAQDTVNVDTGSGAAAAIAVTATSTNPIANGVVLQQVVEDNKQLRGRPLSLKVRLKASTAGATVQLAIYDGAWNLATVATVGTSYQDVTFTYTPSAAATQITAGVWFTSTATFYVDNATLVVGAVPVDYVPLTPADDLTRCLRYYQRWGVGVGPVNLAVGQAYSGTQALVYLPLRVQMGGSASLTLSAVTDFAVLVAGGTTATLTAVTLNNGVAAVLTVTVAAGLVAGNATFLQALNAAAWMALEWNP